MDLNRPKSSYCKESVPCNKNPFFLSKSSPFKYLSYIAKNNYRRLKTKKGSEKINFYVFNCHALIDGKKVQQYNF